MPASRRPTEESPLPTLERTGDVHVLDLGDGENRFSPDWVAEVGACLDEVAAAGPPAALVTAATGKFFSNGLDLDWLLAHADRAADYVGSVQRLFARVLTLPVPTVVAVQGHAFAAGAMLTLAHDVRVMRADRGFWCLPEVDIGIPFTPGMAALIQARLTPATAHEAMTTARRYGGPMPSPPAWSTGSRPPTTCSRRPCSRAGRRGPGRADARRDPDHDVRGRARRAGAAGRDRLNPRGAGGGVGRGTDPSSAPARRTEARLSRARRLARRSRGPGRAPPPPRARPPGAGQPAARGGAGTGGRHRRPAGRGHHALAAAGELGLQHAGGLGVPAGDLGGQPRPGVAVARVAEERSCHAGLLATRTSHI